MVNNRRRKKGGLETGESVMDKTTEQTKVGLKKGKEVAQKVFSKGTELVGKLLDPDQEPAPTRGGGKKGFVEPAIVARKDWAKMGGTPVGKEFCDSSLKKFGGGGGKFDKCSGNVFKGLEGGRKRKSRRKKSRRRKSRRKSRRRKSRRKKKRKSRRKKSRRRRRR